MASDSRKKPAPDFLIRLVGPQIKPWSVPLRTLSRILSSVQRLIDQRDDLADEAELDSNAQLEIETDQVRTLRLIDIKAKSAGYEVASINKSAALTVLCDTGESIRDPDRAVWHPATISSIEELCQIARQLGCIIEFRNPEEHRKLGEAIAVIRPETYADIKSRAFEYGRTSVYGRLERVGGATEMKCGIHVQGRSRMLFCAVAARDVVRDLGKYLYSDVVLSGDAVWYRLNHQMKSLTVTSFSPAKSETSFADIANQLRSLPGGNPWDKIADPEAFIKEMRG